MAFTTTEIGFLCVSNVILFLSWIISLRQIFCITRIGANHRPKFYLTVFVTVFMTFALILNTLIYLLSEYSDYKVPIGLDLFTSTYIIEAFLIAFAFHGCRILGYSIVEQLYMMIDNVKTPYYITFTLFAAQIIITISAFICYTLALFVYVNILYIYIFYIILSVVIFIVAVIFGIVLTTLLKILHNVMVNDINYQKIEASKRAVTGTLIVVIFVCIFCIFHILADVQTMHNYLHASWWDDELANSILHSAFLITIGMAFMLLVFDNQRALCSVHRHSVCAEYCGVGRKKKKKKKQKKNPYLDEPEKGTDEMQQGLLRKNSITGAINN